MRNLRKIPEFGTQINEFPAGLFFKTEAGFFYAMSPTTRYRFTTNRVLESWSPQRIIKTTEQDPAVRKMKVSGVMKFRNGSLLYSHASGKMYLVSDNKLRHIQNPDWLTYLGINRSTPVWVSTKEINLHEMGEPLN